VRAYNSATSGSNVTKTFPRDVPWGRGVQLGTILGEGPPPKIWEGNKRLKFSAISDNFRVWSWISPEQIHTSKIRKVIEQLQTLPRWPKKDGELWSTNNKVIGAHIDPPKLNFLTDYISALRGCWPLKFLHALEIDQGLLAHTPNWNGSPLKKFKGEHVKLGLKFRLFVPITLGLMGVTSRNFTTRCAARQGC